MMRRNPRAVRRIELELDELDYSAICQAVARRQLFRSMPDGEGNEAGRVIAEICRGWLEMITARTDEKPSENDT